MMDQNELLPYLNSEKIIRDLAGQISKDIGIDNFSIQAVQPSPLAFQELFEQLLPLIQELEITNKPKLNFILNRTDISENQLIQALKSNAKKSYSTVISELIIKRELQKVVIRNLYS